MRVVSGPFEKPRVHYEAPPAARMTVEMVRFIEWFNASAPNGPAPPATARRDLGELVDLGALVRTGERKGTRYWLAGR